MITGIGCDIAEIGRFERLISSRRFLGRVFTPQEAARAAVSAETAAGLWAAKEAVSTAMGTGFSGFGTRDIEILRTESGAPRAELHGGALDAARSLGIGRIFVSITHDGGSAMAFAVAERAEELSKWQNSAIID